MKNSSSRSWDPWPVSIIVFFTVAILGCGTFVAFCSRHPADLISSNYYEEEVRYQAQMNRLQETQRRSPLASVNYDPVNKCLKVSVPRIHPEVELSGQIELYRPSAVNLDRRLNLDVNGHGLQIIDATGLIPGLWKVRVSWTGNGHQFFIDQKVVIPSA